MFLNFVGAVSDYFSNELNEAITRETGVEKSRVDSGIKLTVPYSLWILLNYASQSSTKADELYELCANYKSFIQSASQEHPELEDKMRFLLEDDYNLELLKTISNRIDFEYEDLYLIAQFMLPYILGILGKYAEKNQLTSDGLLGFLSSLNNNILDSFPKNIKQYLTQNDPKVEKLPIMRRAWLWGLIILLVSILMFWIFS